MSKLLYTLIILAFFSLELNAQSKILGLGTRWTDSFREWEIQTEYEDEEGSMQLRWSYRDDWTEWDLRIGEVIATARQKWDNDPGLWEVSALGITVTARTTWRGDFRSWRLDDGKHSLTIKSKYSNLLDEWQLRDKQYGNFEVHTYYREDPRDWVVVDELNEDVSYAMRIALMFIAVYHSTPKV